MQITPRILRRLSGVVALAAVLVVAMPVRGADKRIVLIAGRPSHPPGMHEFRAGSLLMQKALSDFPGVTVQVYDGGWPSKMVDGAKVDDDAALDGADAVMIYAQKGAGRRSGLYTDYTFAVRDGEKLVPFTKAYSGLTDKEFAQVDAFVKRNSLEKFGPVRTVKPELVFEIAFEGIAASSRHKSGVALRFPRMSRWRKDKTVDEINTLEDLKKMMELYGK